MNFFLNFFFFFCTSLLKFVICTDYSSYSSQKFVLESSQFELEWSKESIMVTKISNDENYMYVMSNDTNSTTQYYIFVLNITNKEKEINLIKRFPLDYKPLDFLITPDDNYLIALFRLNKTAVIFRIYNISLKNDFFQISSNLTFKGSTVIRNFNCYGEDDCTQVSFTHLNIIRVINISNKTTPIDKSLDINELFLSEECNNHLIDAYFSIFSPKNGILAVVGLYLSQRACFLNLTDMSTFFVSVNATYDSFIDYMDLSGDILYLASCGDNSADIKQVIYLNISKPKFNESIEKNSGVFDLSDIQLLRLGNLCVFSNEDRNYIKIQKLKVLNDKLFYLYFDQNYAFIQLNNTQKENLYFNEISTFERIIDFHLLEKNYDKFIVVYKYSISIFKEYSLDSTKFQYSIAYENIGISEEIDQLYFIENSTNPQFVGLSFKSSSYYIYNVSNLENLTSQSKLTYECTPYYYPISCYILGIYSSLEISPRYLLFPLYGDPLFFNYDLWIENYIDSNNANQLLTFLFGSDFDLKPRVEILNSSFVYVSFNWQESIHFYDYNGVFPSTTTNIVSNYYAAFCMCTNTSGWFMFVIDDENFLNCYSVDQNDPSTPQLITKLYIPFKYISYVKTSNDCRFIYIGGSNLIIINLINMIIDANVLIPNIYWISFLKNFLYIQSELFFYILNVADSKNPFLTYSSQLNHKTPFNKESLIIEDNGDHYIYIAQGDTYSVFKENISYFVQILNKDDIPQVGIPHIYYFSVLDLANKKINSVYIESVNLIKLSSDKIPYSLGIPTWMELNLSSNSLTITLPNTYQNNNLSLLIKFLGGIYSQIEIFPRAESSLFYQITELDGIKITSPSTQNSQIKIELDDPNYIEIITSNFAGIFLSYSQNEGIFIATGFINSINAMLQNLRYTINGNGGSSSFNLTFSDYLNFDLFKSNLSISVFKRNTPPACQKDLQFFIDSQLQSNDSISLTLKKIDIQFDKSWFYDLENDTLIYSFENLNQIKWLTISLSDLRFYGTPELIDEGNYTSKLIVSDSYDKNIFEFKFNIYDQAPIVNKSLRTQINTSKIKVGENFLFAFYSQSFIDPDEGPDDLSYEVIVHTYNESFNILNSSNFWMSFDSTKKLFHGKPTVEYTDQNITFEVIASDGLKTISDNFTLEVVKSLYLLNENEASTSFPFISSLTSNSTVSARITNPDGKIIILNTFLEQVDNLQYHIISNSEINITSTTESVNEAFKFIVSCDFPDNSEQNKRILQTNLTSDIIKFSIIDEFSQGLNFNVSKTLFNNIIYPGEINSNLMRKYYSTEIGSSFRFTIDKNIYFYPNLSESRKMQFQYQTQMTNKENTPQISWLIFEQQNSTLQFYTGSTVEANNKGISLIHLKIIDEFNQTYNIIFEISVDYSQNYYILKYLSLTGQILGYCFSVLASIIYFYVLYNLLWRNRYTRGELICERGKITKLKIPFIGKEFDFALKIFSSIKSTELSSLKNYLMAGDFNNFSIKIQEICEKNEKVSLINTQQQKGTIICLLEAILIQKVIMSCKHGKKLLTLIKNHIKKNTKHEMLESEWFLSFFEEVSKESRIQCNISEFMKVSGVYEICEKKTIFKNEFFNEVYKNILGSYKQKSQISSNESKIISEILIRSIIAHKRGVPFDCHTISFKIKHAINAFPAIKLFPVYYGTCLHLPWNVPISMLGFYHSKFENEKTLKRQNNTLGIFSYIMDMIYFKAIPLSNIEGRSIKWLQIKKKGACLIFKLHPSKNEIRPLFKIQITKANKFVFLQFNIKLMNSEKILYHKGKKIQKKAKEFGTITENEKFSITEMDELNNPINLPTGLMLSANANCLPSSDIEMMKTAKTTE